MTEPATSCCLPTGLRTPRAPVAFPAAGSGDAAQVVAIPGGSVTLGTDTPFFREDGEGPGRKVTLRPFRIDAHAVTNRRFAAFAAATGYRTEAERHGWSYVFHAFLAPGQQSESPPGIPWWRKVDGAFWARPEGPGSDVADRADHPAIHIAWNDAAAFASWAGGRLPGEAEWEYAAKGGDDAVRFPWGDAEPDDGNALCNIWQGRFPSTNTLADGFAGTAPVGSFAPNGFGLFNPCGNVWEWCADPFRVRSLTSPAKQRNQAAVAERERVMKGGSYLCHRSYCYRYRIAARTGRSPDTSAGHTGFRVAYPAA